MTKRFFPPRGIIYNTHIILMSPTPVYEFYVFVQVIYFYELQ